MHGLSASAALATELEMRERALHTAEVRADRQRLEALLDEDFSEVGQSGRCYTRTQMLRHLPAEGAQVDIEAKDFVVALLAPDLAQVRYRSRYRQAGQADAWAERSSLWRRQGSRWRLCFHQATPAP
jgi:hypothetical protein